MGRIKNWKKIEKGMWKFTGDRNLSLYVMIDREFETFVPVVVGKYKVEITGVSYPTFEQARKVAVNFMKKYKDPAKLDDWYDEKASWKSGWE